MIKINIICKNRLLKINITYEICKNGYIAMDDKLKEFFNTHIGKITRIFDGNFAVSYTNIPYDLMKHFYKPLMEKDERSGEYLGRFTKEVIVEMAKTKEELELKLQANKYNL